MGHVEACELILFPVLCAVASPKQYQLLKEEKEITTVITKLKKTKVLCKTISSFINPVWPVCKASRFTIGCRQLSVVMLPLAPAAPDMVGATVIEAIKA